MILILLLTGYSVFAFNKKEASEAYDKGDFTTAFTITESFAFSGDIQAQYELGRMYYKGEGTQKNIKKAVVWWEKSGDKGHLEAQENLVYLYYSKKEGLNNEKFIYWLEKASHQGSANM